MEEILEKTEELQVKEEPRPLTIEEIKALILQKEELEEEAKMAIESYRSLKKSAVELDWIITNNMDLAGAKKAILDDGRLAKITTKTERKYDKTGMFTLFKKVPQKMWEEAYESETRVIHKFKWKGVKKLLELGGEIAKTIKKAMIEDVKRTVVIDPVKAVKI